jgi:hypothetical protein
MEEDVVSVIAILVFLGFILFLVAWSIQAPGRRRARDLARLYAFLESMPDKGAALPADLVAMLAGRQAPDPHRDVRSASILSAIALGFMLIGICIAVAGAFAGGGWGPPAALVVAGLGALPGSVGAALFLFDRWRRGRPDI